MTEVTFEGGRSLHFVGQPTVPFVSTVLCLVEYQYIVQLVIQDPARFLGGPSRSRSRDGNTFALERILDLEGSLQSAAASIEKRKFDYELLSLYRIAESFSSYGSLSPDERLQVRQLSKINSFEVNFDGIGSAVEKVIDSLDPLERKRRQEDLRHVKKMNSIEELAATRDDSTSELRALIERYQLLVDAGVISQDEMAQAIRSTLTAQAQGDEVLARAIRQKEPEQR